MNNPVIIQHDPEEPPRDTSKSPWGLLAVIIALLWAWHFYFLPTNWVSLALGFGTGACFMAWAIEVTGNRVPASWRRKPPRANRS